MLIGLLSVIFASVLPNADPSPARLMGWIGVFVVVNAAMNLALARRGFSARSTSRSFLLRYLVNLAMLGFVDRFVDTSMPLVDALFFVLLFSVLVTAYDRYRPIDDFRVRDAPETKPVLLPSPDAQP